MSTLYPRVPDSLRTNLAGALPSPSLALDVQPDVAKCDPAIGRGMADQPQAKAPGSTPGRKDTRYYSLDLWRGAACLMLVLYHATFYGDYHFRMGDPATWSLAGLPLYLFRHCWVGVPIFFVISGYCIAASVDSLRRRPHSLRDYFIRRVRRIYPPLWAMCGIAVVFILAMSRFPIVSANCEQLFDLSTLSLGQWLGNTLAAESWRHHLGGGAPMYLMPNTWTLCYEEQFYVVTGVLLAVASRRFFHAAAWLTLAVVVARPILAWCGVSSAGFFWDGHWIMFATGMLVYHDLNSSAARQRWITLSVLLLGFGYGAVERVVGSDPAQRHMGEYFVVAFVFAAALLYLRRWDLPIARHWALAPLQWIGQRSYSIYLTHYLPVVVVSSLLAYGGLRSEWQVATIVVPVCVLVMLPGAILFYELVERRFINRPLADRPRMVEPVQSDPASRLTVQV